MGSALAVQVATFTQDVVAQMERIETQDHGYRAQRIGQLRRKRGLAGRWRSCDRHHEPMVGRPDIRHCLTDALDRAHVELLPWFDQLRAVVRKPV